MKKIIILKHSDGELANQLWNFISIYAYCLEKKYQCLNYSFFEYGNKFGLSSGSKIIDFVFFKPFKNKVTRRYAKKTIFFRKLYKMFYLLLIFFLKKRVFIYEPNNYSPYYLPTTNKNENEFLKIEKKFDTIYLCGWLFRNAEGIVKYRQAILDYFKPEKEISDKIEKKINELKIKYNKIIGVHIRQGDYKTFKQGIYWFDQREVRKIINQYIEHFQIDVKGALFFIASDGKIDNQYFNDLNYLISEGNAIEDLFSLSKCDIILGSDSSFGDIAAYFGNIPHIIFKKEDIDWQFYDNKKQYFPNKYCSMVHY